MKTYSGDYTANISFPLGGMGAGSVGLAGNGALVDWEINNRPNRESINPFSNFAIKAEDEARVIDCRFLQGDIARDFMGGLNSGNHSWGYGQGPNRGTLVGGRHFERVEFHGDFPMAEIDFSDERFPGDVTLKAFNPFIPSNDRDSSLPGALFEFAITNTGRAALTYTIAFSVSNPLETYGLNEFTREGETSFVTLNSGVADASALGYGNVTLSTDAKDSAHQLYWYRGGWFDDLTMFLNDFSAFGPIKPRTYTAAATNKPDVATLTATVKVAPGQQKSLRFALSWYVPNYRKYWGDTKDEHKPAWRNYYAKLFTGSRDAAKYIFDNWERLLGDTLKFKSALTSSSLPDCALDAICGNLATLKSSTCLRLTDGDFYGWEGVNRDTGSCEGTCQHVWNYAYALPFLFPALERGVRDDEIKYSLEDCGRMHFRMMLPLGSEKWKFRACVDGQMGTVMKFYREWKLSGDTDWLKSHWDAIKRMIAFAWSPENEDKWDIDKTGVMFGRQHHTLDVELFGAHSWLTGFYHGALLAGAEMAKALDDADAAGEYLSLYEKGHKWLEEHTFNGEYYVQAIDLSNAKLLQSYGDSASINMDGGYWDLETGEIKYQIASGCEIDQVLADWHADLMGLGHIFDQEHRQKALKSIYRLNYKCMRDLNNPCRVFACNGESGVTMCAWKAPGDKPKIPIPYSEEVMTGFEYAYADNLLQCGQEQEALSVVNSVRERYDGKKRNPYSEIECGASYARAMASYSLLLTYSGFKFDLTRGMLGFKPIHPGRYFWSLDGAWGSVEISQTRVKFSVLYGRLTLARFVHSLASVSSVSVNGADIKFTASGDCAEFNANLSAGDALTLKD